MGRANLLAHFVLRFTQTDDTSLGEIRHDLLARLRRSKRRRVLDRLPRAFQRLSAAFGSLARILGLAPRPLLPPPRDESTDAAFLATRVAAYQAAYQEVLDDDEYVRSTGISLRPPFDRALARMGGAMRMGGPKLSSPDLGGPEISAPHPAAATDAVLLAAFVAGDAAAFEALFDRHAARLNGQARRWLRGADVSDAVQEVFVLLFQKATRLAARPDPNVGGFLCATLRFKILRALAARETPAEDPAADVPASGDDGLTAVLRREQAATLMHYVEHTCNPLEQEVMVLDLDDRSDAEIAAELGIKEGHVRVTRHRARAKLRGVLQV